MIGQSIFGWTRVAVAATALLGLLAVAAMAILLWQPAPALAQSPPDAVGSIYPDPQRLNAHRQLERR